MKTYNISLNFELKAESKEKAEEEFRKILDSTFVKFEVKEIK